MEKLVIPYRPQSYQQIVHEDSSRFKVIAAGRRSGKTTLAINELIKNALSHPQEIGKAVPRSWFLTTTYRQAEQIAWKECLKYIPAETVASKNVNKLQIELTNGHLIEFKGTEDPDKLRGVALTFAILDEYGFMRPEVWDEVVRPMLMDSQGRALFIGTPSPDGSPHFHDLWKRGQKSGSEFKSWLFFTVQNKKIPGIEEEIEKAKRETHPDKFRREYEADWGATSGLIYDNFKYATHTVPEYTPESSDYIVGSIDPGLHNPTAAILVAWKLNGQGIVFWEYYKTEFLADENARFLKVKNLELQREGGKVAYWVIDRSSTKRDPASGLTVFNKFKEVLAPAALITAPNDPGSVWAGIDEVKRLFHINPDIKEPKLKISRKCLMTIWELERYIRHKHKWHVERNEEEKPRKLDDHLMDAMRNMMYGKPWIRKRIEFIQGFKGTRVGMY